LKGNKQIKWGTQFLTSRKRNTKPPGDKRWDAGGRGKYRVSKANRIIKMVIEPKNRTHEHTCRNGRNGVKRGKEQGKIGLLEKCKWEDSKRPGAHTSKGERGNWKGEKKKKERKGGKKIGRGGEKTRERMEGSQYLKSGAQTERKTSKDGRESRYIGRAGR